MRAKTRLSMNVSQFQASFMRFLLMECQVNGALVKEEIRKERKKKRKKRRKETIEDRNRLSLESHACWSLAESRAAVVKEEVSRPHDLDR